MYSNVNDVRNALAPGEWPVPEGETRGKTNTAADLSDNQLNDAIREADTQIESYLSRQYAVPFSTDEGTPPEPIRTWSRNLAAYGATLTYRRGKDLAETDPVVRRYRSTMADLVAARDGKTALNLPKNTGPSGSANATAPFNPYDGSLFRSDDFDLARPRTPIFEPGIWVDRRW